MQMFAIVVSFAATAVAVAMLLLIVVPTLIFEHFQDRRAELERRSAREGNKP